MDLYSSFVLMMLPEALGIALVAVLFGEAGLIAVAGGIALVALWDALDGLGVAVEERKALIDKLKALTSAHI